MEGENVFGKYSVAVITPFSEPKEDLKQDIDEIGIHEVLTHVASNLQQLRNAFYQIGGIIVTGSTGEQHSLSLKEKIAVYEMAVAVASNFDVPIIAGISSTTSYDAIQLAKTAEALGCQGIMLGLPPYLRLSDPEIRNYVVAIRNSVSTTIPILLYNNAIRNGYAPSLSLLSQLFEEKIIWGIKHVAPTESEFLSQSQTLLTMSPSIRLYTGSDKHSAPLLTSPPPFPRYYGLTSIIGNLLPLHSGLATALLSNCQRKGNHSSPATSPPTSTSTSTPNTSTSTINTNTIEEGLTLHSSLCPLMDASLLGATLPAGIKIGMLEVGVRGGIPRQPISPCSEEKGREVREAVKAVLDSHPNIIDLL